MDVLINYLFSNAIRHNKNSGIIEIRLAGNKLCFQNTGDLAPLNQDAIFERFYKGRNSDGTGLGLAIMKNICARYGFSIGYRFNNGMHSFLDGILDKRKSIVFSLKATFRSSDSRLSTQD